jgi:hypothetical protein
LVYTEIEEVFIGILVYVIVIINNDILSSIVNNGEIEIEDKI